LGSKAERDGFEPKRRAVVATTGRAVSNGSSDLGGIPKTAASASRKLNYSKDRYLRKSVGKI
jgi:hypothetical protein